MALRGHVGKRHVFPKEYKYITTLNDGTTVIKLKSVELHVKQAKAQHKLEAFRPGEKTAVTSGSSLHAVAVNSMKVLFPE